MQKEIDNVIQTFFPFDAARKALSTKISRLTKKYTEEGNEDSLRKLLQQLEMLPDACVGVEKFYIYQGLEMIRDSKKS